MGDSIIKKHNFEQAKNQIREFTKTLPPDPYFKRVEVDGGLFNWGDHSVTGRELNEFIGTVQDRVVSMNETFRKIIREFGDVYKALDSLDNDYIKGILSSLKAAKIADDKALLAQEATDKAIERLNKAVIALKNFKESVTQDLSELKKIGPQQIDAILEVYSQIENFRTIIKETEKYKSYLVDIHQQLDSFSKEMEFAMKQVQEDLIIQKQYYSVLKSYSHLGDIDGIWNNVETHKKAIAELQAQLGIFSQDIKMMREQFQYDISSLLQFRTKVESYVHLDDVDAMWNEVEQNRCSYAKLYQSFNLYKKESDAKVEELTLALKSIENQRQIDNQDYKNKLKVGYSMIGGIVALFIGQIILQVLGIL